MNYRALTVIGTAAVLLAGLSTVHAMPASYMLPIITDLELIQNDLSEFEIADQGLKLPVEVGESAHPWDNAFEYDTFLKTDDAPRMAFSSSYSRGGQGSLALQFAVSGNITDVVAYSDGGTRAVLVNPEPTTLILFGAGLVGAGLTMRRRRR